jgi:tripartite-type tricarboxylate transporter receptor subunit TctC
MILGSGVAQLANTGNRHDFPVMGQKRRLDRPPFTSGLPPSTDIVGVHQRANCGHRCPLEVKQITERLIETCYVACTVSACHQFGEAAMKVPRRQFLHLAAAAATLPALSRFASAQSYPTRPVHLLEGFGAGGAPDIVARLIGQALSERLGQSFVVENRSGATGNIATEAVVRASPDGYTLLMVTASNAINATVLNLNFDFIRDIAPIAGIVRAPLVMEVHPSIPTRTVAEFITYAKANPGKVNMASAGTGSLTHMAGELFKTMAGVDLFHVPYRGAQVFPALLTGEAQVYFGPLLSSIEYVRAGSFRALAVTTLARSPILPDVPALGETLPGYEASAWYGIGGPKRTPEEVIERLNKELNASIADPKLQARLANLGGMPLGGSPADFAKLISDEVKKWSRVILAANMKRE